MRAIARLGAKPEWRQKNGAAVRTDNGNDLVDCAFGPRAEWTEIAGALDRMPGVVAHGLFLDCFDVIVVGHEEAARTRKVSRAGPGRFPAL
jgi:ribose 5-phosphate isomerase A